jgi:hypothetical protein
MIDILLPLPKVVLKGIILSSSEMQVKVKSSNPVKILIISGIPC